MPPTTLTSKRVSTFTMKQTINFSMFLDAFPESRRDTFSYEGKQALFDYLEEFEDSTGEEIELDIVALCCEYTEYADADEAASQYFDYPGMVFDGDGNETMTAEEVEESAMEYLEYRTTVIKFDGGIIIQNF